jgi:hypothetical protein
MNRTPALLIALAFSAAAQADTLLMERVERENAMALPGRGMSMAQVESTFGAPKEKMAPVGGDSEVHPPITRWVYPAFNVYFERDKVISSVAQKTAPLEEGPKPVPR